VVQLGVYVVVCYLNLYQLYHTKHITYVILNIFVFENFVSNYESTESCTFFMPLQLSASLSFRVVKYSFLYIVSFIIIF
jgi:hypothetical protein